MIHLNNRNGRVILEHLKKIIGRRIFKKIFLDTISSEMVFLCSNALGLCQISSFDFWPKEKGQIDE